MGSGVLVPPPRIPREAELHYGRREGQPRADPPTPTLSVTDGWVPSHGFPFPPACRESSPTSKGKKQLLKMWLFLCWQKWAANSFFPGAKARSPAGVFILLPLEARGPPPQAPFSPECCSCLCAGTRGRAGQAALGGNQHRAWWLDNPPRHHLATSSKAPGGLLSPLSRLP